MEQQTKHATGVAASGNGPQPAIHEDPARPLNGPYAGRPLDGSQYIDVIEEQEYSEQRPSAEEQRPRFSYLKTGDKLDKEQ